MTSVSVRVPTDLEIMSSRNGTSSETQQNVTYNKRDTNIYIPKINN